MRQVATLILLAVLVLAFTPSSTGKYSEFCQLVVMLDRPQLTVPGQSIGEDWVVDVFLKYNGEVDVANIVDYIKTDWFFVISPTNEFPVVLFNTFVRNGESFELSARAKEEDEGKDDEGYASATLTASCNKPNAAKLEFSIRVEETVGLAAGNVAIWDLELWVATLPLTPAP